MLVRGARAPTYDSLSFSSSAWTWAISLSSREISSGSSTCFLAHGQLQAQLLQARVQQVNAFLSLLVHLKDSYRATQKTRAIDDPRACGLALIRRIERTM